MHLLDLLVAIGYLIIFVFLDLFRHLLENCIFFSCSSVSFCYYEAELVELW